MIVKQRGGRTHTLQLYNIYLNLNLTQCVLKKYYWFLNNNNNFKKSEQRFVVAFIGTKLKI